MAAEVAARNGIKVDVYDAMPFVGRKFLMAGKGDIGIVAVGTTVTHRPRTDPYWQNCCIRLLPQVVTQLRCGG